MSNVVHLPKQVSQQAVIALQERMQRGATIDAKYEHYFADGVYVRVMKIPADHYAVGKCHRTQHVTMLIKGKASFTADDGSIVFLEAPFITVTQPGKKKLVYCHEECWFVNVHPTDTEDLVAIEAKVIIPEEEYRAMLEAQRTEQLELQKESA